MGVGPFRISSSFHDSNRAFTFSSPNPDPRNFVLEKSGTIGDLAIAMFRFPGCTNYEGRKVLVYRKDVFIRCLADGIVDPHFCEKEEYCPLARFVPTEYGWELAQLFAEKYEEAREYEV